jgi:superfamily I DNA/RNA helicase
MDEAQRQSWAESAVTKALVPASFQVVHPFNFYICRVEIYRPEAMDCDKNGNVTRTIQIIHEDSEETYQKFVDRLKTVAFNAYSKKSAWREYYAFQDNFAQVRYNYALTVHKSQGSTYENCIVLLNDLNKNRKVIGGKDIKAEERNRIKYVAVSRAKKKLLVIM